MAAPRRENRGLGDRAELHYDLEGASPATVGALRNAMVAASYEIHIKGRISEQLMSAFEDMDARVGPVETVLSGRELDQAALRGVLDRIQGLGLELIEVRRLPDSPVRNDR